MFRLELEVDFSFDRSGPTGFKCSYLPGLFTRKSVDCLFRLVQKICYSTQLYLKLLLRIQHEVPFKTRVKRQNGRVTKQKTANV